MTEQLILNLRKEAKNWNELAKIDPLWTILTSKRIDEWDIKEFFETGKHDIEKAMLFLKEFDIHYNDKTALDFGCGIGRLTQPLCKYFKKCIGVDISGEMINLANKYNKYPSKCKYMVNTENNLELFSDGYFDFVYSDIVLQHIKKSDIYNYIKEFLRILKPEGIIIFQLPYKPKFHKLIKNVVKWIFPEFVLNICRKMLTGTTAHMNMNWISSKKIEKFTNRHYGTMIRKASSFNSGYYSYKYVIRKSMPEE